MEQLTLTFSKFLGQLHGCANFVYQEKRKQESQFIFTDQVKFFIPGGGISGSKIKDLGETFEGVGYTYCSFPGVWFYNYSEKSPQDLDREMMYNCLEYFKQCEFKDGYEEFLKATRQESRRSMTQLNIALSFIEDALKAPHNWKKRPESLCNIYRRLQWEWDKFLIQNKTTA